MLSRCKTLFQILLAFSGLLAVVYTAVQLILFLSYFIAFSKPSLRPPTKPVNQQIQEKYESEEMVQSLYSGIVNVLLLSLFTLQHSAMANPGFKQCINQWGFGIAERSFYIIATSASLLMLFYNWHSIPWYLWQLDNVWVHYSFLLVHAIIWILIYGGCLQMDLPEMIGLKQVYYYLNGLPDPMTLKCPETRRLLGHMRHPSFIGFLLLLWLNPYMSLDRLLLAVLLTIYMRCAWNVDSMDYQYQKEQLMEKKSTLSH